MFVFRGVSPLRIGQRGFPSKMAFAFMAPKKRGPGMMLQVVGTPQPLDLFAAGAWRQPFGPAHFLRDFHSPNQI